jgi:hypothetical protein
MAIDVAALRSSLIGLAIGTPWAPWRSSLYPPQSRQDLWRTAAVDDPDQRVGLHAAPRSPSVAGGAAGIMGAIVGIHGPSISLVFQNTEPRVARAMLGAFFAVAWAPSQR